MPGADDLPWLRATANDLNNQLHVIAESAEGLEKILLGQPEAERYLGLIKGSVERASEATRSMVERAGGGTAETTAIPPIAAVLRELVPPTPSGNWEIENPAGPRELILMVDDEEFIVMLARQVLSEEGYRVITARNGFQAIEIFRELKDAIALVILDFVMPVMDGADVFAELQQMKPDVSVVLSSGFAEQDRLRGMLAKGLRGFIPKPYTQKKLLEQVRTTLDALQAERK